MTIQEPTTIAEAFAQICTDRHPGPACTEQRHWYACCQLLPDKLLEEMDVKH